MRIGWMVGVVRDAELELAEQLAAVGARHAADAEVFHVANRLAQLARRNAGALAPFLVRYAAPEAAPPSAAPPTDGEDPHVGLLRDLRHLHVLATGVVLDWTALGQGAAAARDLEMAAVVAAAKLETTRTVKWTSTLLKTGAAQVLVS